MAEEYTPTDDVIRDWAASGYLYLTGHPSLGFANTESLDRWLAVHDAAVSRQAAVQALRDMAVFFRLASDLGTGERDLIAALACDERAASIEEVPDAAQ